MHSPRIWWEKRGTTWEIIPGGEMVVIELYFMIKKPMSRVVQLLEGDFVQTEGLFKDPFHYAGNL